MMGSMQFTTVLCLVGAVWVVEGATSLTFTESQLTVSIGQMQTTWISFGSPLEKNASISFTYMVDSDGAFMASQLDGVVITPLANVTAPVGDSRLPLDIVPVTVGSILIKAHLVNESGQILDSSSILTIFVVHDASMAVMASVVGWGFLICWSLCVYPLLYTIITIKSGRGISVDFLLLCDISFVAYAVYSCAMYFDPTVKLEYSMQHPGGVQPVQLEDVVLSLHLTLLFCVMSALVFIYRTEDQRLSRTCVGIVMALGLYFLVAVLLYVASQISLLSFMYSLAVIKMVTMPMKYIPQVWCNHVRRSTCGFNVVFAWLDLAAGVLTVLQMLMIAGNGDDWSSLSGNLPKLVLGTASVLFDCIFLVQHYFLYAHPDEYATLAKEKGQLQMAAPED